MRIDKYFRPSMKTFSQSNINEFYSDVCIMNFFLCNYCNVCEYVYIVIQCMFYFFSFIVSSFVYNVCNLSLVIVLSYITAKPKKSNTFRYCLQLSNYNWKVLIS